MVYFFGNRFLPNYFRCSYARPPVNVNKNPPIGPSPRGGPPQKGVNKEYNGFFPKFSLKFRVLKRSFFAFSKGAGGFRELREAYRNHFHLILVPTSARDHELWPKTLLWGIVYVYSMFPLIGPSEGINKDNQDFVRST